MVELFDVSALSICGVSSILFVLLPRILEIEFCDKTELSETTSLRILIGELSRLTLNTGDFGFSSGETGLIKLV